jgi:hypothetical protein
VKLGHRGFQPRYGAKPDASLLWVIPVSAGTIMATMTGYWPAIGAVAGSLGLLILIWAQIIKPLYRLWRMSAPCEVHFTILPLSQVRLDYVLQDDRGHHVKELVVPANSIVEVEIEIVPKTTFHEDNISFGCEGSDDVKPYVLERFDRLIEPGKGKCNWIPGKDDGYSLDRHKYIQIRTNKTRSRGSRLPLGFKLQTRAVGIYPANLFFFTDEGTPAANLTIRVEDRPRTKMKCISHWGCYVTPMGSRG